jgi:hypothetical protein
VEERHIPVSRQCRQEAPQRTRALWELDLHGQQTDRGVNTSSSLGQP